MLRDWKVHMYSKHPSLIINNLDMESSWKRPQLPGSAAENASGEIWMFNLPKPHVPSQCAPVCFCWNHWMVLFLSLFMTVNMWYEFARNFYDWDVFKKILYGNMATLMYAHWCIFFKLPWFTMKVLVYVSVWFKQIILNNGIVLSYVQ